MKIIIAICDILVVMAIIYRNIWFILSTSCQLVGSIAILIHAFPLKRNKLINSFFRNSYSEKIETDLVYDHSLFIAHIRRSYLTFFSIMLLFIGFFLSIIGDKNDNEPWILLGVITPFSFVLYIAVYHLSNAIAQHIGKEKVSPDELLKNGIEPNTENLSSADYDKIFDESNN